MARRMQGGEMEDDLCYNLALMCDERFDGVCGSAFAFVKLYDRHLAYFSARLPTLRTIPASCTWEATCPFCAGRFEIDALSGWWSCSGCARRGEPFGLEYMLYSRGNPDAWQACCRRVVALMEPPDGERRLVEEIAC